MTVQQLSASAVKVQLSAEELNILLPASARTPDSPQMLRLISFMLAKAEAASGIPFSSVPVTVELLAAEDGSLAAYFTVQQEEAPHSARRQHKNARLAARFMQENALLECCKHLEKESGAIRNSQLYEYQTQRILFLKLRHEKVSAIRHILAEFGEPFRLSALNRARLTEYGKCQIEKDAVGKLLRTEPRTL